MKCVLEGFLDRFQYGKNLASFDVGRTNSSCASTISSESERFFDQSGASEDQNKSTNKPLTIFARISETEYVWNAMTKIVE